MAYKPIDSRRDDYRKFLERAGVMETLTKVLCKLMLQYETDGNKENAQNALDFIRKNLGDSIHDNDVIDTLKAELEESRKEIEDLKRQIRELKDGGGGSKEPTEPTEEVIQEKVNSPREESVPSPREEPVASPQEEPVASPREDKEPESTDVEMAEPDKEVEKAQSIEEEVATPTVDAAPTAEVTESADAAKDDTPASPPAEAEAPKDTPSTTDEASSSKEAEEKAAEKAA
uniref:Putative c-myc-binding protein n=1 Tax=Nyssomyia neivai TaxID=330878 RepID=A0A1L8DBQ9_9DIPT